MLNRSRETPALQSSDPYPALPGAGGQAEAAQHTRQPPRDGGSFPEHSGSGWRHCPGAGHACGSHTVQRRLPARRHCRGG